MSTARRSGTPKRLRCGEPLKTKTCSRSAWWPGGRCPQHGYGASTFSDWVRGLDRREAGPGTVELFVRFVDRHWGDGDHCGPAITWDVSSLSGLRWVRHVGGVITPAELMVAADQLSEEGVLSSLLATRVHKAIADALRYQMALDGTAARVAEVAAGLRDHDLAAMACDGYVFLTLADAELLLERLSARA
ncbi:MAG: hypothetical protein M0R28_17770 [Pigmentiphaga sp.]|nr:hypothetical protein [Pigmentiphaga sp.]